MGIAKTFDLSLENKVFPEVLEKLNESKKRRLFVPEENPQELSLIYYECLDEHLEYLRQQPETAYEYLPYEPE